MNVFELETEVCKQFGVSPEEIEGKNKSKTKVLARVIFSVRASKECKASYREIGKVLGNRDSTVIFYYIKKAKRMGLFGGELNKL